MLTIAYPSVLFQEPMVYNNHEAQTLRMCAKLDSIAGFILACTILYRLCIFMSNSGLIPKAASITRAISLVIGRLLLRISFSIVYEIPIREANSFWDIPLASNSSLTTSPGCVGILYVVLSILPKSACKDNTLYVKEQHLGALFE